MAGAYGRATELSPPGTGRGVNRAGRSASETGALLDPWRARVLRPFPAHTHPLTLVADPDGLLADEATLAALAERGFTVVAHAHPISSEVPDPVLLRHRVEAARPFTPERPLVVVTGGALESLPYDLWQTGHHVTLALHEFFPNLAYPVVRALGPAARARLGGAPTSKDVLGPRATARWVLRHAFDADLDRLRQPAALVAWLTDHHARAEVIPPMVAEELVGPLRSVPAYAGWHLETLLADPAAFTAFVRDQWRSFVGAESTRRLHDARSAYLLAFDTDPALQDDLPRLVRIGVLEPVHVSEPATLPDWTRPGIAAPDEDRRPRRVDALADLLTEQLDGALDDAYWSAWQPIARAWAELSGLRTAPDLRLDPSQIETIDGIHTRLEERFLDWLQRRYAVLAGQRLPTPHHVHHVPDFLAYQRRVGGQERVTLLVLDGLALADWLPIGDAWRARHPDWLFAERLLLAQIPTVTAISRQALIGGLRPREFAATVTHNQAEAKLWSAFWAREDLPAVAAPYARLGQDAALPDAVTDHRVRAACLVENSIDEIVHGARLGAADVQASLRLWLDRVSPRLEAMIGALLGRGFTVYLASDHGHVEARGVGQPSEGVSVETRGKRARTYRDHRAAAHVREAFPETELWGDDGLLPEDVWAVMPGGRDAFAPHGDLIVTHGGLTLDEVIVPFVAIGQQ